MIAKETINIRTGDKTYHRILDSNGFIVEKVKLPKGYCGEKTRYVQILTTNHKGLFEIKQINLDYSESLTYIELYPILIEIAPN